MAYRKLPTVKIRKTPKPTAIMPAPFKPDIAPDNAEVLSGEVMGMKASAPEERLYKALGKTGKVKGMRFRYAVGAPRGLPGWKECDFVVESMGLVYLIEVDTLFTHRNKKEKDRLHDAILLNEMNKQGMNIYPRVIHLDGDTELVDQQNADTAAKRIFG